MVRKRAVVKRRFLNIAAERKELPNGHIVHIEMVKHPGAVVIVPFLGAGQVILLRQYRPVIGAFIYELPAGTLETGERPLACARRELQEETGYAARTMKRIGAIYPVPGYSTEKLFMFKAEDLRPVAVSCEDDEFIQPRVFTRPQIKKLFQSGRLNDAKTICGLVLCGWL